MGPARQLAPQLDLFSAADLPPPVVDPAGFLPPMPPIEALSDKKWKQWSLLLWIHLCHPRTWDDLETWTAVTRWTTWRTQNALAVLEGDGRAEAVEVGGVMTWRRKQCET